jgi:hypothetical protein
MKHRRTRFCNPVPFFLVLFAALSGMPALAGAEENKCPVDASQIVYPLPQSACLSGETIVPKVWKVVIESSDVDEIAVARGERLLKSFGLEIAAENGAENRRVGLVVFRDGGPEHKSTFRQEGYSISIGGEPIVVTVSARGPVGFYYAILTLEQLMRRGEAGVMAFTGEITDYPDFAYRGILEGGYSNWSHEKRLAILQWMGALKMNSFIYAPKEGEYFRRRWRVLYPKEWIDKFREYVEVCRRQHIEFAYSLSPALSIEYSDPAEFDRLVAKYRQLQEIGVRKFGIFFDDVIPYLSSPADRARYSNIAEAEVDVTNKLLKALREKDPTAELFFVPNQYWGWTPTRYFAILREKLDPEIQIGWTGREIVSKSITKQDLQSFIDVVGRPPAIGDNWSPLGPVVRRAPDLYTLTDSYLNNPYNFADPENAELSKFVNSTVADYGWNSVGYDPDRSIMMAARMIAGSRTGGDAMLLALRLGQNRVTSIYFDRIAGLIEQLQSASQDEARVILAQLRDELNLYQDALAELDQAPIDSSFKQNLKPAVDGAATTLPQAIMLVEELLGPKEDAIKLNKLRELFGMKK